MNPSPSGTRPGMSQAAAETLPPGFGAKSRTAEGLRRARTLTGQVSVGVIFLVLWEIAAETGHIDVFFVGRPSVMLKAFFLQLGDREFWGHAGSTLLATLWGYLLGASTGTVAGLILGRWKYLETLLLPYVTMLNTMPRVALAPVFILWFGVGIASKVAAAVSLVFFIALINAMAGSRQLDRDLDDLARFLRCSEVTRFVNFVLPVAVPSIFAGLRLGVIYSLLGVVVAEMIAAQTGLGLLITTYTNLFAVSELFAVLLFLMIISATLNTVMSSMEQRLLRWQGRD